MKNRPFKIKGCLEVHDGRPKSMRGGEWTLRPGHTISVAEENRLQRIKDTQNRSRS